MDFYKRDRKATECSLRSAAAKLFARKGYENTRTLEIAKEAGANEALINRYFGGKEGLLMAVLNDEESSPALLEVKGLDVNHPNLREAIRSYFEYGRLRVLEHEEFMKIAMSRALLQPELADQIREKVIDRQMKTVMESLQVYLSKYTLKDEDLEAYAMLLTAMSHTFNFLVRRIHRVEDEKVDRVFDLLTDSLISNLEGHRP